MSQMQKERRKRFKRLPTLGGIGVRQAKPKLSFPSPLPADTTDDEFDALVRLVGSEALAKRVLALKRKYPNGTNPELVVFDWLQRQGWIQFEYQVDMFGGRRAPAGEGIVPDFIVWTDASWAMAWNVQGEYWHGQSGGKRRDELARLKLLGAYIQGARIGAVVELWESDIYRKRDVVFSAALAGVGLRG